VRLAGESLKERLSALSRAELAGLLVVIAVTLGGAGLWYFRSLPRPVQVRGSERPAGASTQVAASPEAARILVDVAGWVRKPGVYEFDEGDRIINAIEAAGGARSGAALDSLNLAAPLVDGTQVLVPREATGGGGAAPPGVAAPPGAPALINANTASATELEALPGIGEVIAQRIVDYRTQNGPFTSVDQLDDVSGIGEAILAEIRDLVTV
jgi:competence protein ComEA